MNIEHAKKESTQGWAEKGESAQAFQLAPVMFTHDKEGQKGDVTYTGSPN